MSERAKMDWSHSTPAGPPVDPSTGRVMKGGGVKGPKGKGGLLAVGIGLGVLLATGDVEAAVESGNPLPNVTTAFSDDNVTAGAVMRGLVFDAMQNLPIVGMLIQPPTGGNIYDQKLADKAIREGRNPFCAQCHGPGGLLDQGDRRRQQLRSRPAAKSPDLLAPALQQEAELQQQAYRDFVNSLAK